MRYLKTAIAFSFIFSAAWLPAQEIAKAASNAALPFMDGLRNVQQYGFSLNILAMLLVGFGFLMVFVKNHGYGATTGNMNTFFPSNNALANAMYANNNRISELPGMRRYYVADRNRNKIRAQRRRSSTASVRARHRSRMASSVGSGT